MKYNICDCVIEVTRRCNMSCAHCLRGCAQNMDINTDYIDRLLDSVDNIGNITFSGGEPSLNVKAILYTLNKCKELGVSVGSFYIVTNGKENPIELMLAAIKWYAYCGEKDICGLALSKDKFHDCIDPEHEELLRGLAFFREDKFTDWDDIPLINEGRAEELSWHERRELYESQDIVADEWGNIDTMVYLSANGDIRSDCDVAFDDDRYTVGNLATQSFDEIVINEDIEFEEIA